MHNINNWLLIIKSSFGRKVENHVELMKDIATLKGPVNYITYLDK